MNCLRGTPIPPRPVGGPEQAMQGFLRVSGDTGRLTSCACVSFTCIFACEAPNGDSGFSLDVRTLSQCSGDKRDHEQGYMWRCLGSAIAELNRISRSRGNRTSPFLPLAHFAAAGPGSSTASLAECAALDPMSSTVTLDDISPLIRYSGPWRAGTPSSDPYFSQCARDQRTCNRSTRTGTRITALSLSRPAMRLLRRWPGMAQG